MTFQQPGPAPSLSKQVRSLLESTTDCVLVLDEEWRVRYLNGRARTTITGGRDAVGMLAWDALPASVVVSTRERALAVVRDHLPTSFEFHIPELERWMLAHLSPSGSELHVFFRDISVERRAQEEARKAGELLTLAQEGAGAGTWDLDLASGTLALCARSRIMHGLDPNDGRPLTHGDWERCVHPDDLEKAMEGIRWAVRTGATYSAEFRTMKNGKEVGWVQGLGRVVPDENGQPERFVGLNIDITERKHADAELKRVQSELIHMSRVSAMGAMASTLAHELNQPLTAVANYARGLRNLLASGPAVMDPTLSTALAGAEENAVRAAQIIRRLRDQVARSEIERRPEYLPAVVREACVLALVDAPRLGISHRLDLDCDSKWVLADSIQIQQVLINLIRNAVEAMQQSERRRLVISSRASGESSVVLRVEDWGPGIAEGMQDRLFAPFATSKEGGLGMGLSICQTIVEAHGGRIWLDMSGPEGTAFCFTLEQAAPADEEV